LHRAGFFAASENRPITLNRYPDGVDGFFFYEKQCPLHRPDWVKQTLEFTREEALKRLERQGDLFAPLLTLKQRLPTLRSIE
jgi:DNA primase